ncbi:MAG: TetR/AcrR family transcriptional regulator [Gammaproteobacteria bacterium]|nr:TetR/AcrR family transcriptional regulator [Gammaproteobacteria bacterium]MDH5628575.1 TetR/AcrR family transcriptional regulator [Gammaproteobacteria bacterium]
MIKKKIGRPSLSPEQKELIRNEIINIARDLFINDGYENTSMRKIAAKAGFAPTKIYYYFENKKEILKHFWDDIATELYQFTTPPKDYKNAPLKSLRYIMQRSVDYWINNPKSYQLGIATQDFPIHQEESFNINDTSASINYLQLIRDNAQACIDQKIFPGKDSLMVSKIISVSIYGIYGSFYNLPSIDWDERELLVKLAIDNTLLGLQYE